MLKPRLTPGIVALSVAIFVTAAAAYADYQKPQNGQDVRNTTGISLVDAIDFAEGKARSRALAARLEREGDRSLYKIELSGGGGFTDLMIDSVTGEVLNRDRKTPQQVDANEKRERAALADIPVDLAQAVRIAEHHLQAGQATAAALEDGQGKLVYEVEVLQDGQSFEVDVDPVSGSIQKTVKSH